ncbi:MAG: DUF1289 domain-containing protein [Candidatus Thioglobus sp.]|nr:DUF1289 domain-containing protein [Candidatus Thioglobus sp.]
MKSPCVSICKYNENKFCIGCNRHMNEIFDWFDYTDDMRSSIMKDLLTRDIDAATE